MNEQPEAIALALLSVEPSGDEFIVYYHGTGPRHPHSLGTFRNPTDAARFMLALCDGAHAF